MAAAKKNTKKRAAQKPRARSWIVPVEATVTGYIVQKALDEDSAVEAVDQILEDNKIDLLSGKTLDLDDFTKLISRGEVSGAMALEEVVPSRKRSAPAKKAAETKKPATKKTAPRGRTRGQAKSTDPDSGKTTAKKPAAKKPAAKKTAKPKAKSSAKTPAKKGRSRGGKS